MGRVRQIKPPLFYTCDSCFEAVKAHRMFRKLNLHMREACLDMPTRVVKSSSLRSMRSTAL